MYIPVEIILFNSSIDFDWLLLNWIFKTYFLTSFMDSDFNYDIYSKI